MDPGWGRGEGTDVVDDGLRGERGREEVGSVWREGQRGGGVGVPRERIHLFVFPHVVYLFDRSNSFSVPIPRAEM